VAFLVRTVLFSWKFYTNFCIVFSRYFAILKFKYLPALLQKQNRSDFARDPPVPNSQDHTYEWKLEEPALNREEVQKSVDNLESFWDTSHLLIFALKTFLTLVRKWRLRSENASLISEFMGKFVFKNSVVKTDKDRLKCFTGSLLSKPIRKGHCFWAIRKCGRERSRTFWRFLIAEMSYLNFGIHWTLQKNWDTIWIFAEKLVYIELRRKIRYTVEFVKKFRQIMKLECSQQFSSQHFSFTTLLFFARVLESAVAERPKNLHKEKCWLYPMKFAKKLVTHTEFCKKLVHCGFFHKI
jgi:hypothetical protein